jgi:hypothetical protein
MINASISDKNLFGTGITGSVGFDVSSGQLSPIYSKPVYLGEIEYTEIQVNNNRNSESE